MDYKINTKVYPRLKALELIEKAVEIERQTEADMIDIIRITTNAPDTERINDFIDDNIYNSDLTPYQAANIIYKELCRG